MKILTALVLLLGSAGPGLTEAPGPIVAPAFTPLKFGEIKPRGWILAQMKRDLDTGFAGHLDELCHEASSDIFASGRNRPGKPNTGNAAGDAWWNGETEGNWRCGHMMLACLTEDPSAMAKAKTYVEHILASQDGDGYIGIFSPELRYQGNGELWTQTCLFRGLLAYADATGDSRAYDAVKRAVDRTIAGYAECRQIRCAQHDAVYTDVLESLYTKTGDKKYRDFGLRLFRECPNLEKFLRQPETNGRFSQSFQGGHGATVTEMMRMPFWFWTATGNADYRSVGEQDIAAVKRWSMPSGALVSEEGVSRCPYPWNVGYEYCAMCEQEFAYIKAGQATGDAARFDDTEHLWFNAMQGSREPDGSAILYCSHDNRPSVHDEVGKRQRYSPTHQQVAVCCNPNSTRVAACFVSNAWLKPTGNEPALAATLYGPCEVKTAPAGTPVRIEETTGYPHFGNVEIKLTPEKPVTFCLWLRNPSWSKDTKVACAGADIKCVGDFWQVRKKWKHGDAVTIRFDQAIREVPAINGEVALQYGPLLYVLPIAGKTQTIKTYKNSSLKDYYVLADNNVVTDLSVPAGYRFTPRPMTGTNPDFPLDDPPVVLAGELLRKDGTPLPVTLVPMGAKSAQLRRVTFPIEGKATCNLVGSANFYSDPASTKGMAIGYLGAPGSGIVWRGLPAGNRIKFRYTALINAQLTLRIDESAPVKVAFPATGKWQGDGAYKEIIVPIPVRAGATVRLLYEASDTPANIDLIRVAR